MTAELLRGRQVLFKGFPINSLLPAGNLLASQNSHKFRATQWSPMVRLIRFYDFCAAQKQSWQTLPALHQLHNISIFLPVPSVFLHRNPTDAPQKVTYNHYFNYDSQYPKYFMGHITKPALFSGASKLANPARIRSVIQECASWLQSQFKIIFLPLGMPSKILQNIGKLRVEVHVTDWISTTYHYASKVWLIFWRRERLQNILFIYVEASLNFFGVHSIPWGVEGIHLFLNLKKYLSSHIWFIPLFFYLSN